MKHTNTFLPSFLGLVFMAVFAFSCNTTKTNNVLNNYIYVTLAQDLSGKYISETYSAYNPESITQSSRSQNQYRATFVCSEQNFSKLKIEFSSDTNVVEMKTNISAEEKPKSGTNTQFGKTKSIRDKN